MELAILNEQNKIKIDHDMEKILQKAVVLALEKHGLATQLELTLVLTGDQEIRQLNTEHRGIDKATDVLSFPQYASLDELRDELAVKESREEKLTAPVLLGDIVISVETARRQGEEYGHELQRELGYLFVHGLLHLLGYDHLTAVEQEKMRRLEESILAELSLAR